MKRALFYALVALVFFLLGKFVLSRFVTALDFKIGAIERELPGSFRAKFLLYSGRKTFTIDVKRPGRLRVKVSCFLKKGKILMTLKGPSGRTVFEREFSGVYNGEFVVSLPAAGFYSIIFDLKGASGAVNISWGKVRGVQEGENRGV